MLSRLRNKHFLTIFLTLPLKKKRKRNKNFPHAENNNFTHRKQLAFALQVKKFFLLFRLLYILIKK